MARGSEVYKTKEKGKKRGTYEKIFEIPSCQFTVIIFAIIFVRTMPVDNTISKGQRLREKIRFRFHRKIGRETSVIIKLTNMRSRKRNIAYCAVWIDFHSHSKAGLYLLGCKNAKLNTSSIKMDFVHSRQSAFERFIYSGNRLKSSLYGKYDYIRVQGAPKRKACTYSY